MTITGIAEMLMTQSPALGYIGGSFRHLISTNLDVSQNKLWSDLFKAAAGSFALSFVGITVAHTTRQRIPDYMIDSLRLVDILRRCRFLPSLDVWLLLNVPFSLSLSLMSASPVLSVFILPGSALAVGGIAVLINRWTLPAIKARFWLSVFISASSILLIALLVARRWVLVSRIDDLALAIAVSWLVLGVLGSMAAIYWSDTPHLPLPIARNARDWHSARVSEMKQEWTKFYKASTLYAEAFAKTQTRELSQLKRQIDLLSAKWDLFNGFNLDGEAATLDQLKPVFEAYQFIERETPIFLSRLAERLE